MPDLASCATGRLFKQQAIRLHNGPPGYATGHPVCITGQWLGNGTEHIHFLVCSVHGVHIFIYTQYPLSQHISKQCQQTL